MAYSNRRWRVKGSGSKEEALNSVTGKRGAALRVRIGLLVLLMAGLPAMAKVEVDFNPDLDFSQFKTYAYIGGVEHLVMLQLNPELINDRVHRAVQRELTKKGLREVQPSENPELVALLGKQPGAGECGSDWQLGALWVLPGNVLGISVRHHERFEHARRHAGAGSDRREE